MQRDETIDSLLALAKCAFQGAATVLYWIDEDLGARELRGLDFPTDVPTRYHGGLDKHDPLRSERLCRLGVSYAVLSRECAQDASESALPYLALLSDFGFRDALDMLIWNGETPLMGIGVFRDAPLDMSRSDVVSLIHAFQRHMENSLPCAPALRSRIARRMMIGRGLTARECDVAEMIAAGASNQDLCEALDIRLPTAKTHVKNCFDKMGVDSRAGLAALYHRPEFWRDRDRPAIASRPPVTV